MREINPQVCFCVAGGQIKLFKSGEDGKDVILQIAGGGSILGVRGVLTGYPHVATAEVQQDATVCFVDKNFITHLIQANPNLALKVMTRNCKRLKCRRTARGRYF